MDTECVWCRETDPQSLTASKHQAQQGEDWGVTMMNSSAGGSEPSGGCCAGAGLSKNAGWAAAAAMLRGCLQHSTPPAV